MAIGIDPTVDFAFKRVLGNPDYPEVTIHFLNAVLGGRPRITQVDFTNPFLDKEAADDKLSVLDVLATDEHGRLLDIEMQCRLPAAMPQRLTYYVSTLYTFRLFEGEDYGVLRPAICICVLDDLMFPDEPDLHLDFRLRGREGQEFIDHLQIHTLELPKYRRPGDNEVVSGQLEKWAYFLRFAADSTPEELTDRLPDREFTQALGVLEMIARTPSERAMYELRMKSQRDVASLVNDARREGADVGREEGREEGRKEGREVGRHEGELKGKVQMLQMLQELCGEPVTPSDELAKLSLDQLQQLIDQWQEKIRRRG